MKNYSSIDEVSSLLGTTRILLMHIIDVGDLLPSVVRLHDGELWHEETHIEFSADDIARFRAEVSRRRFEDVIERHPIIQRDAGFQGFSFGPGWTGILEDAAEKVAAFPKALDVEIAGGKEKFGCLILYVPYNGHGYEAVRKLKEDVRQRSLRTCEQCGSAARLRMGSHRCETLCALGSWLPSVTTTDSC